MYATQQLIQQNQQYKQLCYTVESYNQAVENLSVSNEGILSVFTKFIPMIIGDFVRYVKNFSDIRELKLNFEQRKVVDRLNRIPYTEFMPLEAYVPEGMIGKYIDVMEAYREPIKFCTEVEGNMYDFSLFIAKVVTQPDTLISSSTNIYGKLKENDKRRQKFIDDLAKFYNGSPITTSTYGEVFASNNEFKTCMGILNDCNTLLNKVNSKKMIREMRDTSQSLLRLQENIERGLVTDVSTSVAKELGNNTLIMASLLEYYSFIYYQYLAINTGLGDTGRNIVNNY